MRACLFCKTELPEGAHYNRRHCDDRCKTLYSGRRTIQPTTCPVCEVEFWPIVRGWAGCLSRDGGPYIGFPCSSDCRAIQFRAYQNWYFREGVTDEQRDGHRETDRAWKSDNPGIGAFYTQSYRAGRDERTPAWSDLDAVEQFYRDAPEGMAVDHVIPLHGDQVSGLHVLGNLQYLTPSENSSKHNTYEVA